MRARMAIESCSMNASVGDVQQAPRAGRGKLRLRRVLVVCLAIGTIGAAVFLCAARNHIRSLWSLLQVPGTRMYGMDYYCGYNAAGLYERGIDPEDIPGSLIRNYFPPLLAPVVEAIGGHL